LIGFKDGSIGVNRRGHKSMRGDYAALSWLGLLA